MRHSLFALMTALACLALPAQAQQPCGPLARALSLDLAPAPGGGPRFGVPVTINGKEKLFLLNSAAQRTRVSRSIVAELDLSPRSGRGRRLGRGGEVRNGQQVMVDIGIGPAIVKDHPVGVNEEGGRFDGEFASDLMQNYDIEIDFAGRKLNYFQMDHCEGRVAYWPNSGVISVPLRGWDNNSNQRFPVISVTLDGHEVNAMINTASAESVLDSDSAHALFELSPDSPGAVPMGALDSNPAHRMFGWTFKTLAIGGMSITNPRLTVAPDLLGTKSNDTLRADSRLERRTDNRLPTLQLGMDVLRRLHLYIAAKEGKLYLTQAAEPAPK